MALAATDTKHVAIREAIMAGIPGVGKARLAGFEPATYGLGNRCSIP